MSATSATPTADLLAHARKRGVELSRYGAQRLLRRRGDGARARIDEIAGLIELGAELGMKISTLAATRRLDAAGDPAEARRRMLAADTRRRSWYFAQEWERAERRYYGRDARQRHAVFVAELRDAPLGWQAQMLLVAIADAGLTAKEADGLDVDARQARLTTIVAGFRSRIVRAVDAAVARRYPLRPEAQWRVLDADGGRSIHDERIDREIRSERSARDLALAKTPELGQRIDRFATSPLAAAEVAQILTDMRIRIAHLADAGWHCDPDRYRREVIDCAFDAARTA